MRLLRLALAGLALLAAAPRDASGEVEAWSEFVLLRPKDPARGSGVALVDVVNRGDMTVAVFHLGADRGAAPTAAECYGDALLLRRGLAVLMVGWQWDILPGEGPLHFHPPVVPGLTGLVRSDVTVDAPTRSIPLGYRVGASQALGYPVADPGDSANVLTVRDAPLAERRVVPRGAPGAGGGSLNPRFAQPSRDAQPYSTFFYPTDVFPFTGVEETDPVTGARADGGDVGLDPAAVGRRLPPGRR